MQNNAIQHAGGAVANAMPRRPNPVATAQAQPVAVSDATPFDVDPAQFQAGLERRKQNRTALMAWVRDALVDGTDYGTIKIGGRTTKPSLWKPGAEKIAGMLNLTASFPNLTRYEDMAIDGKEIDLVILRCEIHNGAGAVIAEGIGSRSVKAERGDVNKTLKMAAKSAFIDGILRAGGLSEIFTLDMEDMPNANPPQVAPAAKPPQPATDAQMQFVGRLIKSSAITDDERAKIRGRMDRGLTGREAAAAIDWLQGEIDKRKTETEPAPPVDAEPLTPEEHEQINASLEAAGI